MSKLSITDMILMSYAERERRKANQQRIARGEYTKKEEHLINHYKTTGKIPAKKSGIISFLLILFFGSLGYMYVSLKPGIITFIVLSVFTLLLFPLSLIFLFFVRIALVFIGAGSVFYHNERIANLFEGPNKPYRNY